MPSQLPVVGSDQKRHGHPGSQLHVFIQSPTSFHLSGIIGQSELRPAQWIKDFTRILYRVVRSGTARFNDRSDSLSRSFHLFPNQLASKGEGFLDRRLLLFYPYKYRSGIQEEELPASVKDAENSPRLRRSLL